MSEGASTRCTEPGIVATGGAAGWTGQRHAAIV